jgi:hypothetical protein
MKNMKNVLFVFAFVGIVGWGPFTLFESSFSNAPVGSRDWLAQQTRAISAQADSLSPEALKVGLLAYQKARAAGLDNKELLTIIDYSKSSRDRRMVVVDMKTNKVLFNTWVAHGVNSGGENATSFSNDSRSLKSSLGVFVTSDIYSGKHGESLRVQGLEPGINDNAYRRNVVFHSAAYASSSVAKERGMLGRSWGCMAVSQETIKPLINTIKGKTLVVAYYPDQQWLKKSSFLT